MKKVLVTQRVERITDYAETRDCLDQRWVELLMLAGVFPVLVPNNTQFLDYVDFNQLDGILLTGGNSLVKHGGNSPERDALERKLLAKAIKFGKPVLGVCRGMQLIADYFGCDYRLVSGQINIRHELKVNPESRYLDHLHKHKSVNTFHSVTVENFSNEIKISAHSDTGFVKAIEHKVLPIFGHMRHPEREAPFSDIDTSFFNSFFCG